MMPVIKMPAIKDLDKQGADRYEANQMIDATRYPRNWKIKPESRTSSLNC